MHQHFCRLILLAYLQYGQSWMPIVAVPHRHSIVIGGDNRPSKRIGQKQARGGFGVPREKDEDKTVGTGEKALSAQLDSFVSLKAEGRTVFKVFARSAAPSADSASAASGASAGLKNAWTWVGNACASSDDGHEAVQVQQLLIVEHAQAVSPAFALVKKTLELGWGTDGIATSDGKATNDADVVTLVRKKIETGSVLSGFSGAPVTGGPYYKAKDTLFGAAGDINTKATKVSADATPMN